MKKIILTAQILFCINAYGKTKQSETLKIAKTRQESEKTDFSKLIVNSNSYIKRRKKAKPQKIFHNIIGLTGGYTKYEITAKNKAEEGTDITEVQEEEKSYKLDLSGLPIGGFYMFKFNENNIVDAEYKYEVVEGEKISASSIKRNISLTNHNVNVGYSINIMVNKNIGFYVGFNLNYDYKTISSFVTTRKRSSDETSDTDLINSKIRDSDKNIFYKEQTDRLHGSVKLGLSLYMNRFYGSLLGEYKYLSLKEEMEGIEQIIYIEEEPQIAFRIRAGWTF